MVDDLWLCPIGGHKKQKYSLALLLKDLEIRSVRAIIENTYMRLKNKWTLMKLFDRDEDDLYETFVVCTALHNIDLSLGKAYRADCKCDLCEDD